MASRKTPKRTEFPPKVYVSREEDTDGSFFFTTHETADGAATLGAVELVAEYTFLRVVRIVNRTEVEDT